MAAHRLKTVAYQVEMLGFFIGGFDPVIEVTHRHGDIGKARDQVPVQIHGIQFDMRHRMQDRDAPLWAAGAAAGHIAGVQQFGFFGARGAIRRGGGANKDWGICSPRRRPCCRMLARQGGFGAPVGGGQNFHRHVGQGQRAHRALAASSTSSA